ncbi:hypothetical protein Tco_0711767, partial [Tanacetum coccineum]
MVSVHKDKKEEAMSLFGTKVQEFQAMIKLVGLPSKLSLSYGSVLWKPSIRLAASGPLPVGLGLVDEFACLACFLWHTAKNVTRDPTPVADDFNAQDYATLVAHPSPFRKFLEEFVCLVGLSRHYTLDEETYPSFVDKDGEDIDIFALIYTTDPTKVKVAKRERREDEPWLLETTVGRTIPLLPIAPDCG